MATARTRRRTLWLCVTAAVLAVLLPVALAVMVLFLAAAWGAVTDGIAAGTIAVEAVAGLPQLIVAFVVLAAVAGLGAALGWKLQPAWLAPVAVLVSLLLVISGMVAFTPSDFHDRTVTSPRENLVCQGEGPQVCAVPGNEAYLDPAGATVSEIYSSLPVEEGLPQSILLVDTYSGLPWSEIDDPAVIEIGAQRGVTAPSHLDSQAVKEQLVDSVARHCNIPWSSGYREVADLIFTGNSQDVPRLKELTRC